MRRLGRSPDVELVAPAQGSPESDDPRLLSGCAARPDQTDPATEAKDGARPTLPRKIAAAGQPPRVFDRARLGTTDGSERRAVRIVVCWICVARVSRGRPAQFVTHSCINPVLQC